MIEIRRGRTSATSVGQYLEAVPLLVDVRRFVQVRADEQPGAACGSSVVWIVHAW